MTPLELLHPRGYVRSALVSGDCPDRLRPTTSPPPRGEAADLVIVGTGAKDVDVACAEDGITYVLGRRRAPRSVAFVHLPSYAQSTHVAALSSKDLPASRRARIARLPGGRFLCDVGTLVFRRGVEPLAWLQEEVDGAVITTSRHGATSTFVVRTAHKVAKVGAGPSTVPAGLGEATALRTLGPDASAAGVSVPEVIDELELNGEPVTVESVVPGRSATQVLRGDDKAARDVIERLTAWLTRWNALTSAGDLVAVHQDLTMANLLLHEHELGIVDWASARPDGLPFTDFFYAVLDARAAVNGYRDRSAAFRECFLRGGDWHELVSGLERRAAAALSLDKERADRAFHECWRQHAANEERRGEGTQFREVLELAAAAR
jgi:Phosphotransferase enzyme family